MGNAKIERQYMGKMTPFRLAAPFSLWEISLKR